MPNLSTYFASGLVDYYGKVELSFERKRPQITFLLKSIKMIYYTLTFPNVKVFNFLVKL